MGKLTIEDFAEWFFLEDWDETNHPAYSVVNGDWNDMQDDEREDDVKNFYRERAKRALYFLSDSDVVMLADDQVFGNMNAMRFTEPLPGWKRE